MYSDEELIHISALQHYLYCPRQCALIHLEEVWEENAYTARGTILHQKVHLDTYENRPGVRIVRGLRLRSIRLGLVGRADVVEFPAEFHPGSGMQDVVPVEYKAGEPKVDARDAVQLCAQALCLEEMIGVGIRRGSFFYGRIRRRVEVVLDDALRLETERTAVAVRHLLDQKKTPRAEYGPRCRNCSLEPRCLPKAMNDQRLREYLEALYHPCDGI
ncbi:MAG: CRISPR-associated protein Cas4 [Bacteroidota bacterium]